ncbi:MAG: uracil-DNA glycosylase [Flavobacteriales bacterium]
MRNEVLSAPRPRIPADWYDVLRDAFESPSFARLKAFLIEEREHHRVFPKGSEIFSAFDHCPFERVRVVILGQDPYHGPGQAHGLSFSVPKGIPPPPSLQNIFKELRRDLGLAQPSQGDLRPWAAQGVLLLNATLTVRADQAGSHQGKGWEAFTDTVISRLSAHHEGLVFLLWGRHAQNKSILIDGGRHHVLTAPHPSPLSAHRGFLGCGHFSRANELLMAAGHRPIDWSLP